MVNDTIEKEELEEKGKNKKKKKGKKLPKEISQEILKKMFASLLRAIGIMLYFIVLNLAYSTMKQERLIEDIKVFAAVFLIMGMVFLEKAYKKDNGSKAISGIEFLVLSLHSLSIMHVITLFQYNFQFYLLTSSYIFSIYYVFKAIVLYTKGRRDYLKGLSDVSEIVRKEEPVKKEAKKRSLEESQGKAHQTKKTKSKTLATKTHKKEIRETRKKTSSKTKRKTAEKEIKEMPTRKKKIVPQTKTKTVKKESTPEIKATKKRTTKPKSEGEKETGKKKTTSKTKKEKQEEIKVPQEKRKRGRPKKEVIKND